MATDASGLTDAEASVYDRQLRLWGVAAQARMRASRVLVVSLGAAGCEVAKNLMLAGVNLTLLDGEKVQAADLSAQYLLSPASIGVQTRAVATLPRLRELNPLASADVLEGDAASLSDDTLRQFAHVVVCNTQRTQSIALARACRRVGVPVSLLTVAGLWAVFFHDLGPHYSYKEEVYNDAGEATGSAAHTLAFDALDEVLRRDWATYPKGRAAPPPAFFAWLAVMRATSEGTDAASVLTTCGSPVLSAPGLSSASSVLPSLADRVEIAPVAAVAAGMLAADVLRALTHEHALTDAPVCNTFVYDAMGGGGGRIVKA